MKGFLIQVGSFNTLMEQLEAQVIISVLRKDIVRLSKEKWKNFHM